MQKRTVWTRLTLALLTIVLVEPSGAQAAADDPYAAGNVPVWVHDAWRAVGFLERYQLYLRLNPFYQRGDFDGDGQADFAVAVRHRESGKVGIVIVHRAAGNVVVLGGGRVFGNGGDDWKWMGVWRVEPRSDVPQLHGAKGDVLYVSKPESASAWVYWDGVEYRWHQAGD